KLQEIGTLLGNALATGLENAAPRIAQAAILIGQTIGTTLISKAIETIKNSRLGAIILGALGGAAAGSFIPGVGTAAGALLGGLAGWTAHDIYQGVQSHRQAQRDRQTA